MISRIALASLLVCFGVAWQAEAQAPPAAPAASDDPAALRAEIERLKSIVPGQATAMTQVAYNINNLWFAAHAQNWPLAAFYAGEIRARLRWTLRIQPVRKISTGDLELQPLLDALEKDALTKINEAVTAKSLPQFETAYRSALEGCHSCHVAIEKPYLQLQVPTTPAEGMIRFAPN